MNLQFSIKNLSGEALPVKIGDLPLHLSFVRINHQGVRTNNISYFFLAGRIVLSALYWGVEEREENLRNAVSSSLAKTPGLRVKILLDWCRGTRLVGGQSSVTLLSPLHQQTTETTSRCRLAFYQTPQLRGWLGRSMRGKWNELLGLQHCKVYIFDNSLIISGANLSRDYFTNRQVRNNSELTTYVGMFILFAGQICGDRRLQTTGRLLRGSGGQNISILPPAPE